MAYPIAGAGLYSSHAQPNFDDRSIVNNGIIVACDACGDITLEFYCISNSTQSDVGQITGKDGTILTNNNVWHLDSPSFYCGAYRVQARNALTADQQGIYTCTIPDSNNNTFEINVGLYPQGFSGK